MSRPLSLRALLRRAAFVACATIVAGCASSADDDAKATVTLKGAPTPDPAIARAATVSAIYADAKAHNVDALIARTAPTLAANGSNASSATQAPAASNTIAPSTAAATAAAPVSTSTVTATAAPVSLASPSPNASIDPAIALALYSVDRARFASAFVANYPQTHDALNKEYGSLFVAAHVDRKGALFPILSLATIAVNGDELALERLLGAVPVTEGGIAAAYAAQAGRALAAVPPPQALDALASLPSPRRFAVIGQLDWCARPPAKLLAFTPTPEPLPSGATPPATLPTLSPAEQRITTVQTAIRESASLPCVVAKAPVRKKHGKPKHVSGKHSKRTATTKTRKA